MGKGGGGGPTQTTSTSNTSNIPEYAQPYVETMLGATQKQLYKTDDSGGITGFQPYKAFGGTYDASGNMTGYDPGKSIAQFTPAQQQAQRGIMGLQVPGQYGAATDITNQAAAGSMNAAGQAGNLQNQALGYGTAGAQYGGAGAQYGSAGAQQAQQAAALTAAQARQYGAQGAQAGQQAGNLSDVYGGLGSQAGQTAAGQSGMYGNLGAQSGQQYAGQSSGYGGMGAGYGAQGSQIGQSLGQMSQDPNAVQNYMNPYLQASLNPQLAEIQRQYDITGTQQRSGAAKSGAFGGSREALMSAENQRNAGLAKNQLIGQGYNQAFQQAQQQMNAANQAALSGNAQAMQGAGIGLQGAGQAGSQALAGYGMGLQGAGQAGSQAMQGYGMGLTGANQAGNLRMQGAQAGLQGVGAQQAAANLGLAGTAQGMQGAGLGMQGAQAGQQGVQGAIGAGQYGLQGLGQAGQMAGQLAGIGGQQLAAQQGIYTAQNAVGAQQQQLRQQEINQAIQDYANAQQYPIMQLGTMSNMLRGLPMQAQTTQQYQAQANPITQGIGALGAGASLYNAVKAEGGVVKAAKGGIMSYDVGGAVYSDLLEMEPEQLSKYIKEASSPRVKSMAEQILREKTGKASGGIMRFSNGENVELGEDYKPGEKVEGSTSYAKPPASGNSSRSKALEALESNMPSMPNNYKGTVMEFMNSPEGREYYAAKATAKKAILSNNPISNVETEKMNLSLTGKPNAPAGVASVPPSKSTTQPYVLSDAEKALEANYLNAPPVKVDARTVDNLRGVKQAVPGAGAVAPPRANAAIPPARVNEIVNQNPQLKDAMGNNTPDKNSAETLGIYKDLLKELKVDENKPTDEYAGMSTERIADRLEKDRSKFLGENPSNKQRIAIMAERANAQDEAKRTQAMRMAEFFAMWGSTPGNTIVAGLNAMKNKIPDFIADKKDATKIRRDIDKSIAELDRVDYLEKSGRFDEAGKLRETSRKHGLEWATKMVDLSSRVAISAAQDISANQRNRETVAGRLKGDQLQAAAIDRGNTYKMSADLRAIEGQYSKANSAYETARNNREKELGQDTNYLAAKQLLAGAGTSEKNRIAAQKYLDPINAETQRILAPLQADRDYYRDLRNGYRGDTPGTSASKETVNVGGNTYSKPPNMTDQQWAQYKKEVGIK